MANIYKVWVGFSDMLDNGYIYLVGDIYPRKGYTPTEKRIYELATENNKLGVPLIGDPNVDPPQPEPAGDEQLPYVTVDDSGKILAVNLLGKWDKADMPTELPVVVATDNGDVLTVVNGAWSKAALPKELPTSASNGQVLTYDSTSGLWGARNVPKELPTTAADGSVLTCYNNTWGAMTPQKELPATASNGQVLTYNNGAWGAANPSGGGGITVYSANNINTKLSDVGSVAITFSTATKDAINAALNNGTAFCVKIMSTSGASAFSNVIIPIFGMPQSGIARGSTIIYNTAYGATDIYLFALSFNNGSTDGTLDIMKLAKAS